MFSRSKFGRHAPLTAATRPVFEGLETRAMMNAADLDSSFSGDGRATLAQAQQAGGNAALSVAYDGSVYMAGSANGDLVVTKFRANGTVDASFGSQGKVTIDLGATDVATDIAARPNGGCVVVGTTFVSGFSAGGVVSLDNDGKPTQHFNNGKPQFLTFKADTPAGEVFAGGSANSVALRPDGTIVVAGGATFKDPHTNATDTHFAVAQIGLHGRLDNTFGNGGKVTYDFDQYQPYLRDTANAVAIDGQGRVVVGGQVSNDGWGIMRFTANGGVDQTFKRQRAFGGRGGTINDIAFGNGGRVYAAGYVFGQGDTDAAIIALNDDGNFRTDFAAGGRLVEDFGNARVFASFEGIAVQADGKIVAGGTGSLLGDNSDFTVQRYDTRGVHDTSFGFAGYKYVDFGGTNDVAGGMAFQDNGKIVIGGTKGHGKYGVGEGFAVARLSGVPILPTFAVERRADTAEGSGTPGRFVITRTSGFSSGATVQYQSAGEAKNGIDYDSLAGAVTFQPGEKWKTIYVNAKNDSADEGVETVSLKIKPALTYKADAGKGYATVTIADNDAPAAPTGLNAVATTSTQLYVSWNDNTPHEAGYRVEYSTSPGFTFGTTQFRNLPANRDGSASVQLTGLKAHTKYYVRVRAFHTLAHSAWSNVDSATTL